MLHPLRGQLSLSRALRARLLLAPREAGEATTLLSGLFVYDRPIRVGRRVPTGRGWGPLVRSSQPVQEGPPRVRLPGGPLSCPSPDPLVIGPVRSGPRKFPHNTSQPEDPSLRPYPLLDRG